MPTPISGCRGDSVWVKLDDEMPEDPLIDGLSDGAFRLYIAALCYAQKHQTDGLVPANRLPRLVPRFRSSHVREIVENAGRWEPCGDGFKIRNFEKYNKTKAYWDDRRAAEARRIAEWRAKQNGHQ